jgi:hypothetical protein
MHEARGPYPPLSEKKARTPKRGFRFLSHLFEGGKLPVGWLSDGFSKYETVLEGSCGQSPKGPLEPIRVSKQTIFGERR